MGWKGKGKPVRTVDVDYDMEISHMLKMTLTVTYGIEFVVEGAGRDVDIGVKGWPMEVQAMVGGMPFSVVKMEDMPKDYFLYDWLRLKAEGLTLEECGYTRKEAIQEALDDKAESDYLDSQIGRPI